jgi:DNA modification methylase
MLLRGNCLDQLKTLADNSVDSIVTDPPYGLSFMGKKWDYDVPSTDIWTECLRVLKPGGHLLAFFGTRTYHRGVINIENAGFDIRDQIMWIYGSGFPKSHNIGDGRGTALKPANEPIVVARKPLEKGLTIAQNVLKYGTGALNIDESRIGISTEDIETINKKSNAPKDYDQEIYGQFSKGWSKPANTQGRWPANILFDEEAAAVLDEQTQDLHGAGKPSTLKGSKTRGNIFQNSNDVTRFGDSGGASRFFYVAKASKSERNKGLELNNHPTVKPIKLMQYLITLVTPSNGIVLDPFMGSGSTGVAAKNLNREFIGIELSDEYFDIAEKRIDNAV